MDKDKLEKRQVEVRKRIQVLSYQISEGNREVLRLQGEDRLITSLLNPPKEDKLPSAQKKSGK